MSRKQKEYKYHYTYRITNIVEKKYYYGVHSCNCLPKEDIGVKYFSSSKNKAFKDDIKENPQNYKYKVVKIFSTRKEALEHEIFLHAKFNVGVNKKFYNGSKQTSTKFDTTGITYSDERKKHLSWLFSPENNPFYGKKHTEEMKQNMSSDFKSMKGICEHCGKEGQYHLIQQWHNNNCVLHPDEEIRNKNIEYMKGVSDRKKGENSPMFGKHGKDNKKSFKYELYDEHNNIIDSCYGAEVQDMIKRNNCPSSFRYMSGVYNYNSHAPIKYKSKHGWYLKTIKDWWKNND